MRRSGPFSQSNQAALRQLIRAISFCALFPLFSCGNPTPRADGAGTAVDAGFAGDIRFDSALADTDHFETSLDVDGQQAPEDCDGLDNDGDGLIDNNPTDPEIGMCRGRRRSKWRQ